MLYVNIIRTSVVLLLALFFVVWAQSLDAQDRHGRGGNRPLDEEDLGSDSRTVMPDTESANDEPFREGEEEFPDQDGRTAPSLPPEEEDIAPSPNSRASPSDGSFEEPQVVTSGPPPLPAPNALPPREQVAVSIVA